MNKPVTVELAKMLKEVGLKLNFCREVFYENPNTEGEFIRTEMIHDWELIENKDWYSAPTIAEVVMWLYENHGIWISVFQYKDHAADVNDEYVFRTSHTRLQEFNSPKLAYEAAIKTCMKLIKLKKS